MHPHEAEELEYQSYNAGDYDRQEAIMGASRMSQEWNNGWPWLNTSRDQWVQNPFYIGPKYPHPEDELTEEQYARFLEDVALYYAHMEQAEFLETHEEIK